ncbi:MAG: 4-hydroxy-3-methylbut-2-enyl diphosphate reductase, partial [Candidatus Sumerlaeota bacterium]|nr:4-hydroxy-3-methylbut-2-enyl diphosphate reductase [Candidatus Sumerlaeota bacterium]
MPDRKADKNWGPKATSRPRRAPPSRAIRRSLVLRESVAGALESDFRSRLVESIREHGNVLEIGQTRIALATEFGFCYGVDRAVELAYDTVKRFPDRRIFITAEIIHNPWVNRLLRGMGVRFLTSGLSAGDTFEGIRAEDVVILPAFGASVETRRLLEGRGCLIVDTTCGSVIRVWKRVERDAADGFTSVIHGTYTHEETIATASAATAAGGRFLIVRDAEEARAVCAMIEGRSDAGE